MTGNIALDVVIGLAFVYALYSLFTTTLVEIISTLFQFRARNLAKGISRMLDDDEDDKLKLAKDFFNQPHIKYMASGWLKLFNKPSSFHARNFSQATIQLLQDKFDETIAKGNIVKKKKEKIKAFLKSQKDADSKTGKFLYSLYQEADRKTDDFKASLEQWFDDTMENVTKWYRELMLYLAFIIGLIIATAFNVDTIQIVDKLSKDPKAREQFVEMAISLAENTEITDTILDLNLRQKLLADTALRKKIVSKNDTSDFVKFVTDSVYSNAVQGRDLLYARLDSLQIISQQSQSILNFKRTKNKYFYDSWLNFLGCLITAIAISLGAPFWFDILNKLVQLRSSIGKAKAAKTDEASDQK